MLTDTAVKKAKPADKPYKLTDSQGLILYVMPTGSKSWRLRYRHDGKERQLVFGPYPDLSLADAREERDRARKLLREGRDPSIERRSRAAAAATAAAHTFEKVAREWYETNKGQWAERHAWDVMNSLERDIFPALGQVPIAEIEPPVVLNALRRVEGRGAVETARRLRQRMSAVFVFGIASGICKTDPAAVVEGALKPLTRGRQPAVTTIEEARAVLRDAEATPAHPVTKLALRFLALTVVRPGVICTTPWEELNAVEDGAWRIPAQRMKLTKERKGDERYDFLVPLPRQAAEVIDVLRPFTGRGPLAFPNARFAHRPMSENAMGYLLNRAGYNSRHVPHGWRATFSTIMNERYKDDRHIIDVMLAHVPKDKVEGAYNRAMYLERRGELAQEWADLLLEGAPPASEVVKGRRR